MNKPITELKKLDVNASSFVANGKEYFIESNLSVERFIVYQELELQASFSLDFKTMYATLLQVREGINNGKFLDSGIKVDNLLNGITQLQTKQPNLLKMCALFMNTKEECRATITNDRIAEKIADWSEYEVEGFFVLALTSINGFTDIYKKMLQAFT